jgi:hypothetical protein
MRVLLAVDDTDNLETKGTGHLAEAIASDLARKGWGTRTYVTRHQLLVHPDVPYTSHNSAMCFVAELDEGRLDELVAHAASFLEQESAPGSDPGLCVAVADWLERPGELVAFGERAKREVLEPGEAHALARRAGVHLSAHGGTGGGVIGALAAAGLRLGGNDGRLRGHLDLDLRAGAGDVVTVGALLAHPHVAVVQTLGGEVLPEGETVQLSHWKVKPVLRGGRGVLLVTASTAGRAPWETCAREILKAF